MSKVKIVKKLPKGKTKPKLINLEKKPKPKATNNFTDNYLKFYDDIKIPSRRYDW